MSLMSDRSITTEHGKYRGRIIVTPYSVRGKIIVHGYTIDSDAVLGIICRYSWDDESVEIQLTEKEIMKIYKNLKKEVYINIHPINRSDIGFQYAARITDVCMEKGVDWSSYFKDFKRLIKTIPLNDK